MQLAQDKPDTIKTGSRKARHHSLQEDTQPLTGLEPKWLEPKWLVSSSLSNLVGEICRLAIYDQPAER